jgi:tetratricopeptide (TPR) repeat protein
MRDLAIRYQTGARVSQESGDLKKALEFINDALELAGDHVENYQRKARILREMAAADPEHAKEYAQEARDALNSALRMKHLLTGQRLSLMLDLGNLLVDFLDDRKGAAEWAARTRDILTTETGPGFTEESRTLYKSRLAELDAKLQ